MFGFWILDCLRFLCTVVVALGVLLFLVLGFLDSCGDLVGTFDVLGCLLFGGFVICGVVP